MTTALVASILGCAAITLLGWMVTLQLTLNKKLDEHLEKDADFRVKLAEEQTRQTDAIKALQITLGVQCN